MMKQALTQFPTPWLMAIAFALFAFAMAVIVLKTFNPRRSEDHRRMAQLPLSED